MCYMVVSVERKFKKANKYENICAHQLVTKWSPSGQWIVAVISFQKIYGLHGLIHVIKMKR